MEKEKLTVGQKFNKWLRNFWLGIVQSFQYNKMKLPGLLIAVPGVFLGFFLKFHNTVVNGISFKSAGLDPTTGLITQIDLIKPFDFMGLSVFLLVLLGLLNIFTAASVMSKKNLGSVVAATITSSLIVISAALYFYAIIYYFVLKSNGTINSDFYFNTDCVVSISAVAISVICSVVGIVLGFINYDRTYEKVDR